MSKFIQYGDTIEGDGVYIQVRKWEPTSIVEHSPVKKRMYRYKTSRNSYAEVKKEHVVSEDPDVITATINYHRVVGDQLECSGMSVYVDCVRKLRMSVTEGVTHTHGANYTTTNCHTIASISTPLQNLERAIAEKEKKKNLLNKDINPCQ